MRYLDERRIASQRDWMICVSGAHTHHLDHLVAHDIFDQPGDLWVWILDFGRDEHLGECTGHTICAISCWYLYPVPPSIASAEAAGRAALSFASAPSMADVQRHLHSSPRSPSGMTAKTMQSANGGAPHDPSVVLAREPAWASPPSYFPQFQESGDEVRLQHLHSIPVCTVGAATDAAELVSLGDVPTQQETNKRDLWKISGSIETASVVLKRAQDAACVHLH